MEPRRITKERLLQPNPSFHCGVCENVVVKPKECRECGTLYCSDCFTSPVNAIEKY